MLTKGNGRILVMDDEALIRELLGRMLEKLGYESEPSENGTEAIEKYKQAIESEKPYDAVILDLNVPGEMGGKETVGKIMEIDPDVKAIVTSGYSEDSTSASLHEYGFKGILPKPFDFELLSEMMQKVIKG